MLPFQKTTIYQQTLGLIEEILQSVATPSNRLKVESKTTINVLCHQLAQSVAKGLLAHGEERLVHFKQASHHVMEVLVALDVAEKNRELKTEKKTELTVKALKLQRNLQNFHLQQKKVLILSASMGHGHMSAALAIAEGLQAQYGYDYDVEIVDFMELMNSFMNSVTKKTYENSSKFIPSFFKLLYKTTDKQVKILKLLNQFNYPFVLSKIKKFFEEKKPDVLISTFPVWNYLAFEICKKSCNETKLITMVTDSISVHNVWVLADSDMYIVPNQDTKDSLLKLKVPPQKITILGFPVRLDFLQAFNRKKFLQELELDPGRFTLLFLPTGQSLRKNERILQELLNTKQHYNIIIITGRDKKLQPKLKKDFSEKQVKIIGWTDEMPHFIQSADAIVTKAGGAITMECIAAIKPMIITSVIPGQEEGNAELIKKYHLGVLADTATANIAEQVEYVRKNLGMFQKNLRSVSRPEAALDIAKFLKGLME